MHVGLENHITRLEASMAEGEALLAARDPGQAALVRQRCADALGLMSNYQLFVHREVFEPMMARGDEGQRKLACELKVECIALIDALRTGIKGFMAQEMPFDWDYLSGRVDYFNTVTRAHVARVRALIGSVPQTAQRAAA